MPLEHKISGIPFRIGIGYDVHKLVEGRKLVLGGVKIAHPTGLLGHSDADVLTHAVMSSLLGAMAAGSLGDHFPDTDPAYKDISSIDLLERVRIMMEEGGYSLGNLDVMVICDYPRLSPHIERIRMNLSDALRVPIGVISVKATSTEGLGFTGTGEGIAAQAVSLLYQPEPEGAEPSRKRRSATQKNEKSRREPRQPKPLPKIEPGKLEGCVARIDGASAGNPGPAGIGIVFETSKGKVIGELAEAVGEKTNNEAEYMAALRAAGVCREWGVKKLLLLTDSELLAKQLNGSYKVKSDRILKLCLELRGLLSGFKVWRVKHVRRSENEEADRLSKLALKK
jgi:2-C-methyl-D-erythritol 2,4-cyclodiphosphate synthase